MLSTVAPRAVELLVRACAHVVPEALLRVVYHQATAGLPIAVCLHRVSSVRRAGDPVPQSTARPEDVDTFLAIATAHEGASLTMTFDDGYKDAADYVEDKARRFPNVEWLLFVCPEKVESHAGFRWDLYELQDTRTRGTLREALLRDRDVPSENERPDLLDVASLPEFTLVDRSQCERLLRLPNVTFGNHTNTHFSCAALPARDARSELHDSTLRFEALFGPMRHFAFPFGVPGTHFLPEHVEFLRALRNPILWSTEERPYYVEDRKAGALLPRMVFRGLWGGKAMALWTSFCAARFRWRERERAGDERRVPELPRLPAVSALPRHPAA